MFEKAKTDYVCFLILNSYLDMYEKINGCVHEDNRFRNKDVFTAHMAGKNVIEETDRILGRISFLGYKFRIVKEMYENYLSLSIKVQDGMEEEIEINDVAFTAKIFIAKDLYRIVTGKEYGNSLPCCDIDIYDIYEAEIRAGIEEIADCIGESISYDEIRSIFETGKASRTVAEICMNCMEI